MFLKKGLILLSFIFVSFLLQSCAHSNQNKSSKFLPIQSFLHINKTTKITVNFCDEKKGTCSVRKLPPKKSSASAFVVGKNEYGSYAITAAHVCTESMPPFVNRLANLNKNAVRVSVEYKMTTISDEKYYASVLTYDEKIDMCLLFVHDLSNLESVSIARTAPEVGDKVYNIAAPIGIFAKNMIPILEGRYSGVTPSQNVSLYSLPVAGGSSGSMILNHKGELIGVVHSVFIYFHHLSLGVPHEHTKAFIEYNIQKYELQKQYMISLDLKNIFIDKDAAARKKAQKEKKKKESKSKAPD